jgi:hypothetical protein
MTAAGPTAADERRVPWWPELRDLVSRLERAAAEREGRVPRPVDEVCALIDRRTGAGRKSRGLN